MSVKKRTIDIQHRFRKIGQGLEEELIHRWEKYASNLTRCKRGFSEDAVHDLRISCRRMIAILDILLLIIPEKQTRRLRQSFKKHLGILSPLRDVQVQLAGVQDMVLRYPQLEKYRTVLLLREQRLRKRLQKDLRGHGPATWKGEIQTVKDSFVRTTSDPRLRHAAFTVMHGASAALYTSAVNTLRKIDPTKTKTIHRLRIEVKKLRYTVEILGPVLGLSSARKVKAMQQYQTRLGGIQDMEVLITGLNSFSVHVGRTNGASLRTLREELSQMKTKLIEEYLQSRDELMTFWRPR